MKFDIITIFPHIFDSYLKESILARAQEQELPAIGIEINIHPLQRDVGIVPKHLRQIFQVAPGADQHHFYFALDGAVKTGIEKVFQLDNVKQGDEDGFERWVLHL